MLLELFVKEIRNAGKEVETRLSAVDKVVAVGVHLHVKLYAVLNVCLSHLCAVAEVYVIVCSAVNEEEVSVEICGSLEGIDSITLIIFGWCAHVALGVNGVIILPI